jgi:hypothetical protein
MPRVPFAHSHGECIDGFVELIEDSNGLDDVIVVLLYGELDFSPGVCVTQTKLRCAGVAFAKLLEQFLGVQSDPTEHVLHNLTRVTSLAF